MSHCHDNVAHSVEHYPRHKHIFGCIRQEIPFSKSVRLTPHSAVQDDDGDLFDITPNAWASWVWFIPHTGTREEFAPLAQLREIEMPLGGRVLFVQKVAVSLLRRSIEDAVAGSV